MVLYTRNLALVPSLLRTHQICIESIQTVSGVGVIVWLSLPVTDVVHYLMFPFPRHLPTYHK